MSHETVGLLALAVTLLGTVLASTWRFSSLASKLLASVEHQEARDTETKQELKVLRDIPAMRQDIEYLKKNHSMIPRLESRLVAVEQAAKFSKELRAMRGVSRPDTDEE